MKTIKYILLGVILLSLVISSFAQSGRVTFCETYTQEEVLSRLDPEERFFTLINLENTDPESSRIGRCDEADFKDLRSYIDSEAFRAKVQKDLVIASGAEIKDHTISLYAIRKSASNEAMPLQQEVEEVSISKSDSEENYALLLTFSESGAKLWAQLTRANIGKDIAILFDGKVISAPRVQEEIKGGKLMISGKFSESEIKELKAILEN